MKFLTFLVTIIYHAYVFLLCTLNYGSINNYELIEFTIIFLSAQYVKTLQHKHVILRLPNALTPCINSKLEHETSFINNRIFTSNLEV